MKTGEVVPIMELRDTKYSNVLCYPRCEQQELLSRLKELKTLGVKALEFTGQRTVFGIPVLGKGYVGVVVVAHTSSGIAALKIRRIDSDRSGMFHEAQMLQKANAVNVGPKLIQADKNFLLMQLIEGLHFPEWHKTLDTKEAKTRVCSVIKDVLEQCYRLDMAGLDHGELSKAPKHIIIDENDNAHLIDFETASIDRRVSNVTSVCQYLFLGTQIADKIKENVRKFDKKELVKTLRPYKQDRSRENFEKILETVVSQKL